MNSRAALLLAAAVCASCRAFSLSTDDLRNDPHGHLVWAARTGDVAAIRRLAASGIDLDRPLFIAAFDNDPTIAWLLFDAGADVNLSRKALTEDGQGGPLWHLVVHAAERMSGQSRKEALERPHLVAAWPPG